MTVPKSSSSLGVWGSGVAIGQQREEAEEDEAVCERGQNKLGGGQAEWEVPVGYLRCEASSWTHESDSGERSERRYDLTCHPGGQDYKGATGLSKSNTWRGRTGMKSWRADTHV